MNTTAAPTTATPEGPEWLSPLQASEALGVSPKRLATYARHGCLTMLLGDRYRQTKIPGIKDSWFEIHSSVLTEKAVYVMLTGSVHPSGWGTGWRPELRAQADAALARLDTTDRTGTRVKRRRKLTQH